MHIRIEIPEGVTFIPKKGDTVSFSDSLFSTYEKQVFSIPITKLLGIKPEKIFHVISVRINEKVQKKSVLAEKHKFLHHKRILSPCDGEITNIDHIEGTINIKAIQESLDNGNKKTVHSFFNGKIVELLKNSCIIEIENGVELKIENPEKDFGGRLYIVKEEFEWFRLNEEQLKDTILVSNNITKSQAAKSEALGCIGFIIQTGNDVFEQPHIKIHDKNIFNKIKNHTGNIIVSKQDKKAIIY